MTQTNSAPSEQVSARILARTGATGAVAPVATMGEHLAACWVLARLPAAELRKAAGISVRSGRINRLALRMRRAGAIIRAHPNLIDELRNLPLRTILSRAEEVGKGSRYVY